MDIQYTKTFIRNLSLPEDMIRLISGFAQETVPFKKELLENKFTKYTTYTFIGNRSIEKIYLCSSKYFPVLTDSIYIRGAYNKEHCTFLFDSKYLPLPKTELIRRFRKLNNIKELSRLSRIRYNKYFTNLNEDELCDYMGWYIMHYS